MMKKGKLKFYNPLLQSGCIIDLETGKEYKISAESMKDAFLKNGDKVIFEITKNKDGLNAINVRSDLFKLN
jgi:cold shock CspA family protein